MTNDPSSKNPTVSRPPLIAEIFPYPVNGVTLSLSSPTWKTAVELVAAIISPTGEISRFRA